MTASRILIVDDEPQIRRVLHSALTANGYEVIDAGSGSEAINLWRAERPDLAILDMNMPGMNGLEACRLLRCETEAPIIFVSVRNSEKDKVEALDAGADDYLTKPFGMNELLARIRAALRRSSTSSEPLVSNFKSPDLEIDFTERRVLLYGENIRLRPKEFELLRHLVSQSNKPVSHRKLIQVVWGPEYGDEVVYLRVLVNQLRKKLEPDLARPRFILTEPRFGYRFSTEPVHRAEVPER